MKRLTDSWYWTHSQPGWSYPVETQVVKCRLKIRFTAYSRCTSLYTQKDMKKMKLIEPGGRNLERISSKWVKFAIVAYCIVYGHCPPCFWRASDFKRRNFNSCGMSAEGWGGDFNFCVCRTPSGQPKRRRAEGNNEKASALSVACEVLEFNVTGRVLTSPPLVRHWKGHCCQFFVVNNVEVFPHPMKSWYDY